MSKYTYKVKCRCCGTIHEILGSQDWKTLNDYCYKHSTFPTIIRCKCLPNDDVFADFISYSKPKID